MGFFASMQPNLWTNEEEPRLVHVGNGEPIVVSLHARHPKDYVTGNLNR